MGSIAYGILDSIDSKYFGKLAPEHSASEMNHSEIEEWVLSHIRETIEE